MSNSWFLVSLLVVACTKLQFIPPIRVSSMKNTMHAMIPSTRSPSKTRFDSGSPTVMLTHMVRNFGPSNQWNFFAEDSIHSMSYLSISCEWSDVRI